MIQSQQAPLQKSNDSTASICKSIPTSLQDIYSQLQKSRNTEETKRIQHFIQTTSNSKQDFEQYQDVYTSLLVTGDNIYGTSPSSQQIQEIVDRNKELHEKKKVLEQSIRSKKQTTEQMNQDFIDERNAIGVPVPLTTLHVLEDYTLAVYWITYIFMAIAILYMYVQSQQYSIRSIGIGIGTAIGITGLMVICMLLFL